MKKLAIKFLYRVRIHDRECYAFTRVSHNGVLKDKLITNENNLFSPAVIKRFLVATFERKKMSTKTSIKRLALIAVASLSLGLVSSVSANATAGDGVLSAVSGSNLGVVGAISGSTLAKSATVLSTGKIAVTTADAGTVVVSAGAAITSGGTITSDQTCSTSATSQATTVVITPTGAAGTTFTISGYDGDTCAATGALADVVTVTIASASNAGTASASNSTAAWTISTGTDTADVATKDTTTRGGQLYVYSVLKDVYSASITTAGAFTAEVSSGAVVAIGSSAPGSAGTYSTAVYSSNPSTLYIRIDEKTAGTGWNGTLKLSYNGVVIATKSGKITGDVSKITTTLNKVADSDAATNTTDTIRYQAYDSAGNIVALTTPNTKLLKDSSSNSAVISTITAASTANSTDGTSGKVGVTCTTAGSSDVVLYYVNAAGTTVKSNSLKVLCGGNAYSFTASFDKASYKQGDVATLTIKFADAAGNPANSVAILSNATTADQVISAPNMTRITEAGGYATSAVTDAAGTLTYKFSVAVDSGVTPGAYNAIVSFPHLAYASDQSVAYTITSATSSVTNAEVLAAIVKLIASINKQITALQKLLTKKK